MTEAITWMEDGTPYNPRFGDRYHSSAGGGLTQAREVFLAGCGLPAAWAGRPFWTQLETGFGFGLNFLVTWQAWRDDPQRPHRLHFISTEAYPVSVEDLLQMHAAHPELYPLAQELARQYQGLTPGLHRITLEGGRVLLTLCIGDAAQWLRRERWTADGIYLDGFGPRHNPEMWSEEMLKGMARHCRTGTRLSTWCIARSVRDALAAGGFTVRKVPGVPPKRDNLHAVYEHGWTPSTQWPLPRLQQPEHALVIGGGLAGAGVAHALAQRGWQVTVLDRAEAPAAGASGLPAGLFCPHVSPDDSVLSRLSRAGIQVLRPLLERYLREGEDWAPSGVLEHRVDLNKRLPAITEPAAMQWSRTPDAQTPALAWLSENARTLWHAQAGWLRPARLVQALLDSSPRITWQPRAEVRALQRDASRQWQALDAQGQVLAQAPHVILAAGFDSLQLLEGLGAVRDLRPVRGQALHGLHAAGAHLPDVPINGHGALIAGLPTAQGPEWVLGATFERGQTDLPPTPLEQAQARTELQDKLTRLLGTVPAALHTDSGFPAGAKTFSRVRCVIPDRLPAVGVIDAQRLPSMFLCTGMGARGLTLSMLCGEWLAAQLHGEPLPVERDLSRHLDALRLMPQEKGDSLQKNPRFPQNTLRMAL